MLDSTRERQPILPYPSPASVAELVIAMIERSSGVILPDNWPDYEPFYLNKEYASGNGLLREAIEGAIAGAEPGKWLSQELEYFERMIAEDALEQLASNPSGRTTLDAIRATAVESFRNDPDATQRVAQQEEGDDDD